MEEIEISSWQTLDAIRKSKSAEVVETVGNLQTGHFMSVFCVIEEDFLELCYSDTAANYLRRYETREELEEAVEERKEDEGDSPYDDEEERDLSGDYDEEEKEDETEGLKVEDEPESESY